MSARDLVGRPLVPFFDAEDNVNEALQVDMATQAQEQLDVDARVWDRELGYFVYPNEDASTSQHSHSHSQPIAIKKTNASSAPATASADAAGSYGKLLLTPDMLSRSAPSNHSSGMEQMQNHINHNHAEAASATNSRAATPRSTSAKRSSRQKSRSSTPNKSRNKQQSPPSAQTQGQPSDGGSSGGEDRTTGSDGSEKGKGKKNNKNGEPGSAKKTRNKQQQQQQQQQTPKSKDELSGNGKWAWSAFQSSPDPKSLPLPPFVAGGGISPGAGALPPPLDPPKIEERLDPPPPVLLDRPPSVPPDAPPLASIEHSMTQDLRRMLNIGS